MKSIEEANEYFENQQAKANLRDYRDAVPEAYSQLTNAIRHIIHSSLNGQPRQQALDILGEAKTQIAKA